jgi:hypothetical protein
MAILSRDKKLTAKEIVLRALEVSEQFSAGVRSPFNILEMDCVLEVKT